jgi:chromosome segregation ATPase
MLEDTETTTAELEAERERKRLPRSQRDKRKIAALSEEIVHLKATNDELMTELVELRDVHAIALQNLDLYRRKGLK